MVVNDLTVYFFIDMTYDVNFLVDICLASSIITIIITSTRSMHYVPRLLLKTKNNVVVVAAAYKESGCGCKHLAGN